MRGQKTLVLVHGAWHGSWCWQRVVPLLEHRGLRVHAVDLPSTRDPTAAGIDLSADAAAVHRVIEEAAGDVTICGHSYGGMVISHRLVGSHPRATRLIYLCAFMPDDGQSLLAIGGGRLAPWIQTDARDVTARPEPGGRVVLP